MAIFITDNKLGLENVPKVDNWQDYLIIVKNILYIRLNSKRNLKGLIN